MTTSTPGRDDRRRRAHQAVRRRARRRRPLLHRRPRPRDRLPRPQRRRQDHHPALPARPRRPHVGQRDDRRPDLPRPRRTPCGSSARRSRPPASTPGAARATTCGCSRAPRASTRGGCPRCSSWSGCRTRRPARWAASASACASACSSPRRCSATPGVLVLDEPANGLDPEGIAWLRSFLRYLAGQGRTVLVSSHVLSEVEQTVDDVVIIAKGRLVRACPLRRAHRRPQPRRRPHAVPAAARRRARRARARRPVVTTRGRRRCTSSTPTPRRSAHIAFGAQVELHELRPAASDLEQVFLSLTGGATS